jgi:hypothetical protein
MRVAVLSQYTQVRADTHREEYTETPSITWAEAKGFSVGILLVTSAID